MSGFVEELVAGAIIAAAAGGVGWARRYRLRLIWVQGGVALLLRRRDGM